MNKIPLAIIFMFNEQAGYKKNEQRVHLSFRRKARSHCLSDQPDA